MRQKTLRGLTVGGVALLTLTGCLMRKTQINTIFDEKGLPVAGSPITWMLAGLSALLLLLAVLSALGLKPHPEERGLFGSSNAALIAGLASGTCLAAGAILSLYAGLNGGLFGILLPVLQLIAALCILVAAWQRKKTGASQLACHAIACIWLVLVLLLNFKRWSTDPTIIDYCFRLFALICGMCATYHVGAFCLGKGSRRITAFWCLAGCYFSLVSAIGESWSWALMAVGLALWQLSNAWQLLGEETK